MTGRQASIAAAVVLGCAVAMWLFGPGVGPAGTGAGTAHPAEWYSPTYCAQCHQSIYDEWVAGLHSQADSDPERLQIEIAKNFSVTDCNLCHAPRSTFENIGRTPAGRMDSQAWPVAQGVDCASCHLTPAGMASADSRFQGTGIPPAAVAPCKPIYTPALASVEHCKSCHNQHLTVNQWEHTRFAKPGAEFQDCRACHMPQAPGPATNGRPGATHFSHLTPGSHTPAMVRRAIALRAVIQGDAAVVTLDTRASGHNFPTDYRTRFGLLRVEIATADGGWREIHREKWRQPFRNEPGGSTPGGNTQLAGDTVHTRRVPLDGQDGAVRIRLFYSLRPYTDQEPGRFSDFTTDTVIGERMFLVHEVTLR